MNGDALLGSLGQAALLCAFVVAAYGFVAATLGFRARFRPLVTSARNAAFGVAVLAVLATAILVYAFVSHDFALQYVVENSRLDQPLAVTISGVWGGQPGSLLLWSTGLAVLGAIAAGKEFRRHRELMPGMLATLFAVQSFFLGVLGLVAGPFQVLPVPAADGRGLNPLLWDVGMRIHPPLLLTGYMSFAIPFAFGMAVLLSGRLGREWLRPVRNWMLLSWTIQGAGLLTGAWWAYHVLGWGGYWGWDPVENAALLPWLTATAFLHSIMAQERRGMFKVWNLGLVIGSFTLAIFGTFVVRSGVLSSVHSFAQSTIGVYFFAFLGLVIVVSLGLLLYRLPRLKAEAEVDSLVSREVGFLLNNVLLVAIAAATFWGTIFPLVAEIVQGAKLSVGAPFYQQVNGPMLLLLLVLMGVGPLLAWRRTPPSVLWRNVRWPLLAAALTSVALVGLGMRHGLALVAAAATAFALATIGWEFWRGMRLRHRNAGEAYPTALLRLITRGKRRYGGYIVHLGMVLIACGVIGSSFYQREDARTLSIGDSLTVGRYTLRYTGLYEQPGDGLDTILAQLTVHAGDKDLGNLWPERRQYRNWEDQPVTGVAYRTVAPWFDDLYVLLTGWDDNGAATFRVFVNPLVIFIWWGGVFFLIGTLIAAWPERRPARSRVLVADDAQSAGAGDRSEPAAQPAGTGEDDPPAPRLPARPKRVPRRVPERARARGRSAGRAYDIGEMGEMGAPAAARELVAEGVAGEA